MKRARSKLHTRLLLTTAVIGSIVLVGGVTLWISRHDLQRSVERATLPKAVDYREQTYQAPLPTAELTTATKSLTTVAPKPSISVPAANLAVPFTPQAPHANWDDPYGEFCEEASVLMAMSYIRRDNLALPDDADAKMLAIKAFEEKRFGYYKDTTAAETATIIREYYNYNAVQLLENPTVNDIKQAVAAGKPVIVPAAGRELGNPYYQQPGPLYHMLVVKGYTAAGKFIVNDPGTRRGADFLYKESVLMNAIHDWRSDTQIEKGRRVIIVVG